MSKLKPDHIRVVRLGHGGNCSSVGSVIDTLFLSAAVGSAMFAAICATLEDGAKSEEEKPVTSPPAAPDE